MGENKSIKAGKLLDWDKDSLIRKAKAVLASKIKQGMDSLLPMGGQMFSSRWTGPHHLQWWFGKTNSITPNIHPSSFSPRLYTENDATSGIYLWSVWVAYPRCVSSPLPMHSNVLPTMAIQKAEKALSLCNACSAYTKASLYYQPWVPPKSKIQSHTNHSDKIVPAKTSTLAYILSPGLTKSFNS